MAAAGHRPAPRGACAPPRAQAAQSALAGVSYLAGRLGAASPLSRGCRVALVRALGGAARLAPRDPAAAISRGSVGGLVGRGGGSCGGWWHSSRLRSPSRCCGGWAGRGASRWAAFSVSCAARRVSLFSCSLVLATVPAPIERAFGGLDRVAVWHRRAAVAGVLLLLPHVALVSFGPA